MFEQDHRFYMNKALMEARKAFENKEIPVGAVIVKEGKVIGRGFNMVEQLKDPTAHAEMIAISSATSTLDSKWLTDCTLYVNLEPCPMCAGALIHARFKLVVFGAFDSKWGSCSTLYNLPQDHRFNHKVDIISGVLEEESTELIQSFFKNLRNG